MECLKSECSGRISNSLRRWGKRRTSRARHFKQGRKAGSMASLIPCAVAIGPTCSGTLACKARVGGARWRSKVDELRWLIRVGRRSSRYTFQREGVEFGPVSDVLSIPRQLPPSQVSPRYHFRENFVDFRLDTISMFVLLSLNIWKLKTVCGYRTHFNSAQIRQQEKNVVVSAETQRGWRFHPVGFQYLAE